MTCQRRLDASVCQHNGYALYVEQIRTGRKTLTARARAPTVEALVEVADSNIGNLGPGGYELRAKAKAWLAQAKDSAAAQAIAAENERLKNQIADLQRQVNELAARFSARPGGLLIRPGEARRRVDERVPRRGAPSMANSGRGHHRVNKLKSWQSKHGGATAVAISRFDLPPNRALQHAPRCCFNSSEGVRR